MTWFIRDLRNPILFGVHEEEEFDFDFTYLHHLSRTFLRCKKIVGVVVRWFNSGLQALTVTRHFEKLSNNIMK